MVTAFLLYPLAPERTSPMDSPLGSEYVQPADRPTAWAALAAGLANDGRSPAEIAQALWVDEFTVIRLLENAGRVRRAA